MKGTFFRTSAVGIATSFSCDSKGGLDKGSYFSNPLQSGHAPVVGHSWACHKVSIYTFLILVNKKMMPARKKIVIPGQAGRKNSGLTGGYEREKCSLFIAEEMDQINKTKGILGDPHRGYSNESREGSLAFTETIH